MPRIVGFHGHPVVDLASLPEYPGTDLRGGTPLHPAYLQSLPDDKVSRSRPEYDPARTNRLARRLP